MNLPVRIITTEDGSHSLYNDDLKETYHSQHGAIQESRHVFMQNGLDFYSHQMSLVSIRIFEMGFGTGLNVLLSAQWARIHSIAIHMTSIEAYPVPKKIIESLNYPTLLNDSETDLEWQKIHRSPWGEKAEINDYFTIKKIHASLEEYDLPAEEFDIIYYDAFAPAKQMELWDRSIFRKIRNSMVQGGALVTYCARGQFKRDLTSLELSVETLPGPPGKYEMVRATRRFK